MDGGAALQSQVDVIYPTSTWLLPGTIALRLWISYLASTWRATRFGSWHLPRERPWPRKRAFSSLPHQREASGKQPSRFPLAVYAAARGERIAILDRDAQKSVVGWQSRRKSGESGVDVLAVDSAAEALGLISAQGYDWLIVDTPPALMERIDEAVSQADIVLIPSRASMLDLDAIHPALDVCVEFSKPYLFVLNSVDTRQQKDQRGRPNIPRHLREGRGHDDCPARGLRLCHDVGKGADRGGTDGKAAEEIERLWGEIRTALAPAARKAKHAK